MKSDIQKRRYMMPNHITNLITFGSDTDSVAAFQKMLQDVRVDGNVLGSIDFNKLIPMPPSLEIEWGSRTKNGLKLYEAYFAEKESLIKEASPQAERDLHKKWERVRQDAPEEWELGKKAFHNIRQYGHPSWYQWSIEHWGTKWNAYQFAELTPRSDTMEFQTAWSSVPEIIRSLSLRYSEQTISYRWADENIGHNVGELTCKSGMITDLFYPESGSREAYEMSAEILGVDLSDYGLYLNKDGTTYEYLEHPPKNETKNSKGVER